MYFSNCKKFQEIENEGQGDKNDGSQYFSLSNVKHVIDGIVYTKDNCNLTVFCDGIKEMPVFCILKIDTLDALKDIMPSLVKDFDKADSMLLIRDETTFLENMRYIFKLRVFA